jgi:hypothetical protein
VQHEGLLVGALERVDELLVLAGAERGDHQRLGLAAGEQRRAVGARQDADLGDDRADRLQVAAVDALARVEDVAADDVASSFLKRPPTCCGSRRLLLLGEELGATADLRLDRVDGGAPLLLVGDP